MQHHNNTGEDLGEAYAASFAKPSNLFLCPSLQLACLTTVQVLTPVSANVLLNVGVSCRKQDVLLPLQDVSSGKPVQVGDTDLYGMEIDVAAAAEEIRSIGKADKGKSVDDVLGSFGLGAFAEQLKDLRLSMLLSETHVASQKFLMKW